MGARVAGATIHNFFSLLHANGAVRVTDNVRLPSLERELLGVVLVQVVEVLVQIRVCVLVLIHLVM